MTGKPKSGNAEGLFSLNSIPELLNGVINVNTPCKYYLKKGLCQYNFINIDFMKFKFCDKEIQTYIINVSHLFSHPFLFHYVIHCTKLSVLCLCPSE